MVRAFEGEEIEGYDEMIVLRGIRFESHCEHHMAPIIGIPLYLANMTPFWELFSSATI